MLFVKRCRALAKQGSRSRSLVEQGLRSRALAEQGLRSRALAEEGLRSRAMEEHSLIEQRLNPLTGAAEWVVIKDAGPDGEDRSGRWDGGGAAALAHTQYLDMLNDQPRNRAYNEAIKKVVKANDHVLDIGAGTGLLSMMAWRAIEEARQSSFQVNGTSSNPTLQDLGSKGQITACESYLPMVRLARKLFRINGVGSDVRLVHKRSDEIQVGIDMPSKADVLVSEILDSELLGEGLIPTLRHAQEHLLSPNARVVPHHATVYGQLVECDYLWRCHDLAGVEAELRAGLVLADPASRDESSFGSSDTFHVDGFGDQLKLISEPFEVFNFDFSRSQAQLETMEVDVSIVKAGALHALVSWWVLYLDEDGLITYSTAPKWTGTGKGETSWRDHWKQCVWTFPGRGVTVIPGDEMRITAVHDALNVRYELRPLTRGPEELQLEAGKCGTSTEGPQSAYTSLGRRSRRIGLLGDASYRALIREALTRAVQAESEPVCLVVDDSIFCALSAAQANQRAKVLALLPGLKRSGSQIMKSLAAENSVDNGRIEVIGKAAAEVAPHDLEGKEVNILIAEPFYNACQELLPWSHLRFWHERSILAPFLVSRPKIIPCEGILRCVAVCLPDLWHSRRALNTIEGFDFSSISQSLGACGEVSSPEEEPPLPYSLWQCGYCEMLTEAVSIMKFDFSLHSDGVEGLVKVPVLRSGLCHAVVLWMDWVMDSEKDLTYSTGPSGPNYWKQGIKLLRSPLQVRSSPTQEATGSDRSSSSQEKNDTITISSRFSPQTGDLQVEVFVTS